jgi:hypothetical protein
VVVVVVVVDVVVPAQFVTTMPPEPPPERTGGQPGDVQLQPPVQPANSRFHWPPKTFHQHWPHVGAPGAVVVQVVVVDVVVDVVVVVVVVVVPPQFVVAIVPTKAYIGPGE